MYKAIKISAGRGGWGGPLVIQPTDEKNMIVSVTGGGIDGLTKKIAEMTGGTAGDGFSTGIPEDKIAVVIIDCGGTARCGVYPKKRIPTVNLMQTGPSGPLAKYITEDIYVSGVKPENLSYADGSEPVTAPGITEKEDTKVKEDGSSGKQSILIRIGKAVGGVVGKFFQAGRDTIDMVIRHILPFMAFVSVIIGIINGTGLGNIIAKGISPLAGNLIGMIILSFICAIPVISPIIGPGAVIAQIVGVLVGEQIGAGNIKPAMALPALFAIDAQVGGDFVPVGLALGEAEPETINVGVPAVLFSRMITGPLAVVIAWLASFLLPY
ncbi:MAG: PTS glucitol/sorbitol transporter subunit IIB [Spirochaetales bacterium]|jgi:PTS system glucitol/sorbitol-specific IIC component|nr:PTS glucitol/sorbitol transporter subunit IIB [Spirochaetales bacterium]